jgi:hypothetical protein
MCAREGENERQNAFARGMSNLFPVSKYTHLGANFEAQESNNFVEDACTTSNAVLLQCCGTCKAKRRSCDPFALTAKTDGSVLERNRAAESDDRSTSVPSIEQTFPSTPSQSAFERTYKRASSPAASLHWSQKNGFADDAVAGQWYACQFLPHRSHRTSRQVPSSKPQATQGASRLHAGSVRHSSQYQSPSGQSFNGHMDIRLRCWTLSQVSHTSPDSSSTCAHERHGIDAYVSITCLRSCP